MSYLEKVVDEIKNKPNIMQTIYLSEDEIGAEGAEELNAIIAFNRKAIDFVLQENELDATDWLELSNISQRVLLFEKRAELTGREQH